MLSIVWPGVCKILRLTDPIEKIWPSLAIIDSNNVDALGPNIIGAPVDLERLKWPLTKSAWKWVSNIYLILILLFSAFLR